MDMILNLLQGNIGTIINAVIGISVVAAIFSKLNKVVKEVSELLVAYLTAAADGKFTKEEINTIVDEADDIVAAFKEILTKKDDK